MFKQSSKTRIRLAGKLLIVTVACMLLALTNVNAQYKGFKRVLTPAQPTEAENILLLANPGYDIDQCANLDPTCNWVNGELGHQNSDYAEGDTVPFRVKMTNLTIGQKYSYTISWDATDNPTPNHGYDYLQTYNKTVVGANICKSVTGCPAGGSTAAIPIDDVVRAGRDGILGNADDVVQPAGVFTLLGGNITGVSGYTYTPAPNFNQAVQVTITISFTATAETAVLAWGGHISTRLDWGNKSAIGFPGSPYHMRNGSFCVPETTGGNPTDCKGGNADLQIKVSEVTPITGLRIIKEVNVPGGISSIAFPFISTGGAPLPGSFSLVDNNTAADRITQQYAALSVPAGPITVVETLPSSNWTVASVTCTITSGDGSTGTAVGNAGLQQALINLTFGDFAECTFVNIGAAVTAASGSISGRVMTQAGMGIRGALVTVFDASTNTTKMAMTNSFGYYRFVELPVENFYILNVSAKRYTFSHPQQAVQMHDDIADFNFTSDQ